MYAGYDKNWKKNYIRVVTILCEYVQKRQRDIWYRLLRLCFAWRWITPKQFRRARCSPPPEAVTVSLVLAEMAQIPTPWKKSIKITK